MKIANAAAGTAAAGEVASGTATQLAQLIEMVLTRIPLWIAAGVVILFTVVIAKIARNTVENKLAEKGLEEEHKELQILGGRMTYAGILVLGVTVGLKIAGIDLTTIIAAGAFGIGFALKDLIMNFLAGVMILIGRHFALGDFISVGGTLGKIVEIQSRVTIMQAIDGTKVIVPNAELFTKQVTSFTSNPFRRIEAVVTVDYRCDLENAVKICMKAVKGTKGILIEPSPAVVIDNFGENGIELKVRGWVESRGGWIKIRSDMVLKIKEEFDRHEITIPWPIRTIVYDKDSEKIEKMIEEEVAKKEHPPQAQPQKVQPQQPQQAQVQTPQQAPPQQKTSPPEAGKSSEEGDGEQPLRPLGETV